MKQYLLGRPLIKEVAYKTVNLYRYLQLHTVKLSITTQPT